MSYCIVSGHGGVFRSVAEPSINGTIVWLLEIACYGAVNIYALITGYVYVNANHKYSKILKLWLSVFFYSFFITLIYKFVTPSSIDLKTLIKSAFPVLTKQYWYFTAYFGLFIFIPFLNTLIKNLDKKQHQKLIISIILCFCIFNLIGSGLNYDTFLLNNGYSLLWLVSLYIIGAYLQIYKDDFKKYDKKVYLYIYLGTILTTFLLRFLYKFIGFMITGVFVKGTGIFVSYISPFILLSAVAILLYFSRLEIKEFKNIILKISSLSFGVYIISSHPLIMNTFVTNQFSLYAHTHPLITFSNIIIRSLCIFWICIAIEWLRVKLFEGLRVDKVCEKIVDWCSCSKISMIF